MSSVAETARERHTPFTWNYTAPHPITGDAMFVEVTSCKECAHQGKSEEEASYPCLTIRNLESAAGVV